MAMFKNDSARALTVGRFLWVNGVLLILVFLSCWASIWWGPGGILSVEDLRTDSYMQELLWLRLPNAVLAALVGAALSVVGVAFQSLLRNPLADPFIMGVSGGAALGGTLALVFLGGVFHHGMALQGPAAFGGAMLATLLVYHIGRINGRVDTITVLLVGVVFNAFASAVIMFLKAVVSSQKTQEILFWLMGNLSYQEPSTLLLLGAGVLVGVLVLLCLARQMNALSFGEEEAMHLGVNVEKTKAVVFFTASLLVGLAVSVSGLIGFVGLIVPHLIRLVLGPDHRLLLPASALAGASFLVLCELVSRLLFVPFSTEPPVGVVTAFMGGPFFLLLLRKRHHKAFVG